MSLVMSLVLYVQFEPKKAVFVEFGPRIGNFGIFHILPKYLNPKIGLKWGFRSIA